MNINKIIDAAEEELRDLMKDHDVGGHGMDHMLFVAEHAEEALNHENLPEDTKLQIYLAALLHDADDHKIFKNSHNYSNARNILNRVITIDDIALLYREKLEKEDDYHNNKNACLEGYREDFINFTIEMIELVSCSKNRDSDPPHPWMAIPRDCDRLEAIGEIGIKRCKEVTEHFKSPYHTDNTARVYTEEELWKVATPERFANYKSSPSMIDHYYDKLLHIGDPERLKSQNYYILKEAKRRNRVMVDFVLNYWKEQEN